jgi:hypothetical protein
MCRRNRSAFRAKCWRFCVSISALAVIAVAQSARIASPDGLHILFKKPPAQLWLENTKTGETRLIHEGTAMEARWSPGGSAFFVNDGDGSDLNLAYVFDAQGTQTVDLRKAIVAADSGIANLAARASHVYVDAIAWQDSRHVLVDFDGHTDRAPVRCFEFRYRVSVNGAVTGLWRRFPPLTSKSCR